MTNVNSNKANNAFEAYHAEIEDAFRDYSRSSDHYEGTLQSIEQYISRVHAARAKLLDALV